MQRHVTARIAASLRYRGLTRRHADPAAAAISVVLGEPDSAARHIARASYVQNQAFEADYDWLATAAPAAAARRLAAIEFARADELAGALTGRRQPLVIAALHMGHYVPALLRCVAEVPQLRAIAVIKRAVHSNREDAAYRHRAASVAVHILRLDQRPLLPALAVLRAGGALLTMMDVPPTFGRSKTQATMFLGRPAYLPLGPASIAVAAGAIVLPIATWPDGRRDVLDCAAFIDARRRDGESRPAATARVHDALAGQCTAWIRAHPKAWMLWGHIGAFFTPPADAKPRLPVRAAPAQRPHSGFTA